MFYAHFVLSKKGPLARIWLAAHWDKKLTRAHVFETNISSSVEAILEPKVKLALRTSGHLLLGVVRIYSRQAKYLLADCNEAFVKIKMAFRPGADIQEESHRDSCSLAAITLADNIHDFESTLAELTEMDPYSISVNQSRPEDITMREEFGEPNLGRPDDDFGDSTFEDGGEREYGAEHVVGDAIEMDDHHTATMSLTNELVRSQTSQVYAEMPPSVSMASNDEFGDMMDVDYDSGENLDRNMEEAVMFQDATSNGKIGDAFSQMECDLVGPGVEGNEENAASINRLGGVHEEDNNISAIENIAPEEHTITNMDASITKTITSTTTSHTSTAPGIVTTTTKRLPQFVLPPVTQSSRIDHRRTAKRKRRLLIDEHKSIPSDVMKMQMQDTSEITTRLDLAPPTRKLMLWKETGSVDSLFSTPGRAIPSRVLQRLFYRNLRTLAVPNDSPDGLPIIRTMKMNEVPVQARIIAEEEGEEVVVVKEFASQDKEEELDKKDNESQGREQEHSGVMMMPPGACSTYSANYDCFSAHGTPHREENDNDVPAMIEQSLTEDQASIEQARISTTDTISYSTDAFEPSFNDRSIASVTGIVPSDVDRGDYTESESCHNKLQNTMLALDNELDIIDRQFPIEMTQEGLEKRSEIMLNVLQDAMKRHNQVVFQHLTVSNNKKQAASKFYTLLLLGKQKAITLHQETPFSNIIITTFVYT